MTKSSPELKNIQAILGLERETRDRRPLLERITDVVSGLASSPALIAGLSSGSSSGLARTRSAAPPFVRYPSNLLTLAVSLEAIVLTGFVLMAQNRVTQQADKRAHLDLQINLLAEQELTAILRLQCLLAGHAGIDVSSVDPRLDQLRSQTDVQRIAATIETEMAAAPAVALCPSSEEPAVHEMSRTI